MEEKKSESSISDNMENCPDDNTKAAPETGTEIKTQPRGFSPKKNIIIIALAGVLALGIGGTAAAVGISNSPANRVSRYMGAAERYLSEMNYEQAIIEFQRILEIDPMNVDAYLGMAEAYIALGDIDNAIEILRTGLEQTGDDRIREKLNEKLLSLALERGNTYLSEEKYPQAESEFLNALEIDEKCIEAYIGKADSHIGGENIDKAIEVLQKGLDITGDTAIKEKLNYLKLSAALKHGREYLTAEKYWRAESEFAEALGIDDKCVEAYIGIADAYLFQDKDDDAERALRMGINKTYDDRIKTKLSELLADYLKKAAEFLRDKYYSEAISCYNKVLRVDEKCAEAYIGIADSYIGLDETYKEIQILETGYEKTKDERIRQRLNDLQKIADALKHAKELYDNELYEQAAEEYERAQEIDPMCVDAYLGEANSYAKRGDTHRAIEIMDKGKRITGSKRLNWK